MFVKIILVVFFSRVEVLERFHFNGNLSVDVLLLLFKYFFYYREVGRVGVVNACAILTTTVITLLVYARWVDRLKV